MVCEACHTSCSSCDGPNKNQCLSCPSDSNRFYALDNTKLCLCLEGFYDNNQKICS